MPDSTEIDFLGRRIKSGDIVAFEQLYNLMSRRIFKFAYSFVLCKEDAEEIMNDVFVKIWNNREMINESKSLQSFLFTITRNATLDKIRKYSLESLNLKDYTETISPFAHENTEDVINSEETSEILNELIKAMPQQQRKVFELSRLEGMSHQSISEYLGISKSSVEKHITKSLHYIKEELIKRNISIGALLIFFNSRFL